MDVRKEPSPVVTLPHSQSFEANPLFKFLPEAFKLETEEQVTEASEKVRILFQQAFDGLTNKLDGIVTEFKRVSTSNNELTMEKRKEKKDTQVEAIRAVNAFNALLDSRVPVLTNTLFEEIFNLAFLKAHTEGNTKIASYHLFGSDRRGQQIQDLLSNFVEAKEIQIQVVEAKEEQIQELTEEQRRKIEYKKTLGNIQDFASETAQVKDLLLSAQLALQEIRQEIAPYLSLQAAFAVQVNKIIPSLYVTVRKLIEKSVSLNTDVTKALMGLEARGEVIKNAKANLVAGGTQPNDYVHLTLEDEENKRLVEQLKKFQSDSFMRINSDTGASSSQINKIAEEFDCKLVNGYPDEFKHDNESLRKISDSQSAVVGLKELMHIAKKLKDLNQFSVDEWQILSNIVREKLLAVGLLESTNASILADRVSVELTIANLKAEIAKIAEVRKKFKESLESIQHWITYDPDYRLMSHAKAVVQFVCDAAASVPAWIGYGTSPAVNADEESDEEIVGTPVDLVVNRISPDTPEVVE